MHRRTLLAAALAASAIALSGCGFQPLYGGPSGVQLDGIALVQEGDQRIDYLLRDELRNAFPDNAGRYRLVLEPADVRRTGSGIGADGIATRYDLLLTVSYRIYEDGNPEPVFDGSASGSGTYNIPLQPYAAITSQREGEELAARAASNRITLQVARFLRTREGN